MEHLKRNGPRAAGTARKANVTFGKPTNVHYLKPLPDASAYARAWVARRCRLETRWAGVIVEAAGLGGRP